MGSNPDYREVAIPEGKSPTEYTYAERRAELLRLMQQKGHPKAIDQSQASLAKRYDVSQQQISKDFDRIKESLRESVGEDAEVGAEMVFQTAVVELLDQGRYMKAARVQKMWYDWMFDAGIREREPERIEHGSIEDQFLENLKKANGYDDETTETTD